MSNFSQQQNSLNDSSTDSITITGGADTLTCKLPQDFLLNTSYITSTPSTTNSYYSNNTTTINGGTSSNTSTKFNWITGSTSSNTSTTSDYGSAEPWIDSFPDWSRVQDMCKQYPGLEIVVKNFKTFYELVKYDYDNPAPKK